MLRPWTQPRASSRRSAPARTSAALATSTATPFDAGALPRCWPTGRCRRRRSGGAGRALPRLPRHRSSASSPACVAPLAQLPPRGSWKASGGVVYEYVDRWVGRPLVEPDVRGDRPPLPAGLRPGLGRRRHRLVRRHPARPGAQGHGRPGPARGRGRQGALRRARGRARRRGRARAGAAARHLRQRLALPRRPRPGHRPRGADRLDGASTAPARARSSSTAGSIGLWRRRGRPGRRRQTLRAADQGRAVRARRGDRPASRRCSPVDAPVCDGVEPQRGGARDSSAAAAATPAVEVRSTSAPRRTATAPAPRRSAATSSSVRPPSGPTTTTSSGRSPGRRAAASGAVAVLVQHDREVGRRDERHDVGGRRELARPRGARTGAPAWRPRGRWTASGRATWRPARPSRPRRCARPPTARSGDADLGEHLDRELAAVALGQRLHDDAAGVGSGTWSTTVDAVTSRDPLAGRGDLAGRRRPRAVGEHDLLPDPQPAYGDGVVRLVALDRAPRDPAATPAERRDEVDAAATSGRGSVRVERVAQPAEDRLAARLAPGRSAAPRRGSRPARAAAPPGAGRAGSGSRRRSSRPGRRDRRAGPGTPRPRSTCSVPDWVPGRMSRSKVVSTPESRALGVTTSASRVGSVSVVPSAAAVIGTVTVQCRSLPCRVNVVVPGDVDLDVEVAGRAAAGADLALLGELDPGAGVDAGRDLDGEGAPRADPAVAGALAARVGDDRAEAAAGRARAQGADLAEERALHVGDLAGAAAGLARRSRALPGRRALAVTGRADHGGVDLELAGRRRTPPRRGRSRAGSARPGRGVRAVADRGAWRAARLAAEERVHDVGEREAGALAEAEPAPPNGSPPRSYAARFCGSESTS